MEYQPARLMVEVAINEAGTFDDERDVILGGPAN
jgi:hypothetical protein